MHWQLISITMITHDILKIFKKWDARSDGRVREKKKQNKGRMWDRKVRQGGEGQTRSNDEIYLSYARLSPGVSRLFPPLKSLIHQSLNISKQRPVQRSIFLSLPRPLSSLIRRDARTLSWALFKSLKHRCGAAASTPLRSGLGAKFLDFARGY